eukprot:TRINITY_DN9124_c0_g2_i1.p1 TRINITY_DN9124_c0_g2~~TRINITY_DN9124_c0_g2_i1.p1  ORF type:complete len:345 (+),score=38.75 TRINITY_DN9124_c0_g2_i1:41-1036(+)
MPRGSFEIEHEQRLRPAQGSRFDTRKHDVTNMFSYILSCFTSLTLSMEDKEVKLIVDGPAGKRTTRMVYEDLGFAEKSQTCYCCHGFSSRINSADDEDINETQATTLWPGWGCSAGLVDDIVRELRERMENRIRARQDRIRGERVVVGPDDMLRRVEKIAQAMPIQDCKIDKLLEGMGVPSQHVMSTRVPRPPIEQNVRDDTLVYDVTQLCTKCLCCGMAEVKLLLDPEGVSTVTTSVCSESTSHEPYSTIGHVSENTFCCFCREVNGHAPGFGCDTALVAEISRELKMRLKNADGIHRLDEMSYVIRWMALEVERDVRGLTELRQQRAKI